MLDEPVDSSKTLREKILEETLDGIRKTKEDLDQQIIVIFGKKRIKSERWFMGFQEMFLEVAKDKRVTDKDKVVLYYLFGNLEFENFILITQKQIAEDLEMRRPHVSRAVKRLVEAGYINCRKAGRNYTYRINPNLVWKGRVTNRGKVLQMEEYRT